MRLDSGQIEVVDDTMAELLRGKTGPERLMIAFQMFDMAREMIRAKLKADHPDWDEDQIRWETVRRLSHGSIHRPAGCDAKT